MTIEYNVRATVYSDEYKKQIEITIGRFDKCSNALLFKKAYEKYYSSRARIVEKFVKED